jgi:hypothetical protein
MRSKVEQRKKGAQPLFFKNIGQGKPTTKDPRMMETIEKNPRKQPIQCCSCGGGQMRVDCPQRGDKVRTTYIV